MTRTASIFLGLTALLVLSLLQFRYGRGEHQPVWKRWQPSAGIPSRNRTPPFFGISSRPRSAGPALRLRLASAGAAFQGLFHNRWLAVHRRRVRRAALGATLAVIFDRTAQWAWRVSRRDGRGGWWCMPSPKPAIGSPNWSLNWIPTRIAENSGRESTMAPPWKIVTQQFVERIEKTEELPASLPGAHWPPSRAARTSNSPRCLPPFESEPCDFTQKGLPKARSDCQLKKSALPKHGMITETRNTIHSTIR